VEKRHGFARKSSEEKKIAYTIIPGEAAFSGPKIDIKLVDAIWPPVAAFDVQSTSPAAALGLEYVAEDGTRKQPVMVHRALYGIGRAFSSAY